MYKKKYDLILFMSDFHCGGTEKQFYLLARELGKKINICIIALYGNGIFWDEVNKIKYIDNIALITNRSNSKSIRIFKIITSFFYFSKLLRTISYKKIYTSLYYNNILVYFAIPTNYRYKLVWGVRSSNGYTGKIEYLSMIANKFMSKHINSLICNSYAGFEYIRKINFRCKNLFVVHNGIDFQEYYENSEIRRDFRSKIKCDENDIIFGIIGRINAGKGHLSFLKVCHKLIQEFSCLKILILDGSDTSYSEYIVRKYNEVIPQENLICLKQIKNLNHVYNCLDVLVSCSQFEGTSNVILEAIYCGKLCFVSNVGDSSKIINNANYCYNPQSTEECYNKLKNIIKNNMYKTYDMQLQKKIMTKYSLKQMVSNTYRIINSI